MQQSPRAKNAPILTRRLFARVLFSASIIVVGVLYMYFQQTVEDGRLSKRDQTMVSSVSSRRARL
jgi:Ca2+-transporting ATPase